jgi:hypothetical protein
LIVSSEFGISFGTRSNGNSKAGHSTAPRRPPALSAASPEDRSNARSVLVGDGIDGRIEYLDAMAGFTDTEWAFLIGYVCAPNSAVYAEQLGISQTALWKRIERLHNQ